MYEVSFSGRVRELLDELAARNPTRMSELGRAVREIERLLHVYPQFGEPLQDLSKPGVCLWVGVVPPLTVHYVVIEADDRGRRRQVSILRPLTPLPNSGLV